MNKKRNYYKPILSEHGDLKKVTKGRKCCPPDTNGSGGQDDPS